MGPGAGGPCRPVTGPCPGRVVVTLNPQSSSAQWEVAPEKGEDLELSVESPCELREPEPSPFSSKRTMYETEEVRPGTRASVEAPWRLRAVGKGLLGAPGDVTQHQREFRPSHLVSVGSREHPRSWGPGVRALARAGPAAGGWGAGSIYLLAVSNIWALGSSSLKAMRVE